MTTKDWFDIFICITITILILLIAELFFDYTDSTKNLIPSIITGTVSLFALYFGYLNTKDQQRLLEAQQHVQIKTTIHKEWVEKVRTYIAEIIEYYLALDKIISRIEFENTNREQRDKINYATLPKYKEVLEKFIKNRILLSLYLDFLDTDQEALYQLTSELWERGLYGDKNVNSPYIIKEIQESAQTIFKKKLEISS